MQARIALCLGAPADAAEPAGHFEGGCAGDDVRSSSGEKENGSCRYGGRHCFGYTRQPSE